MATFIFACAACGAQVVCDNACRKYCNGCKDEVRKARMRNYYHAGLRGTIIGSESKCAGCDGSFTRVSSRQKFCPPCGREKRRMDTIIWKEKVGYSNKRPNAKTRIGDMVTNGLIYLSAAFSVLLLVGILAYVFLRGIGSVNWSFLTTVTSTLNKTVGIAGNIINTLYIIKCCIYRTIW